MVGEHLKLLSQSEHFITVNLYNCQRHNLRNGSYNLANQISETVRDSDYTHLIKFLRWFLRTEVITFHPPNKDHAGQN
jgi:hypothetical protein